MYLAVGLTPARDSTSFAEQGRAPKTGMVFDRSSLMPNRQWLKGSSVRHSFVYGAKHVQARGHCFRGTDLHGRVLHCVLPPVQVRGFLNESQRVG